MEEITSTFRNIRLLLEHTFQAGASDLHVSVQSPPMLRVDGALRPIGGPPVGIQEAEDMAQELLGSGRYAEFDDRGDYDFAYALNPEVRFRVNIYRQRGRVSIAARAIPVEVPTLGQLGLPSLLSTLAGRPQGLVLVTGPTGSGKSSTLAAMIQQLNQSERKHIVTLEDPIEYLHGHGSCLIDQREIGSDTRSFATGLRAALRQDPDVILVGEMRDPETIAAAVTAAETGHLVLSTLHTSDAPGTIERIIDVFPAEQQNQIRSQLASVLAGVISQRLFPKAEGRGRVCATEILINTPAVANLIRSDKCHQIRNTMQTGRALGMHTLDMSIQDYLRSGQIHPAAAKAYLTEVTS
ncbi:type IV pilus twitching motility protein PilT [Paenibacillus sp. F411]|uniref:type IV pilus twitching motility protein PilT n=1 Tax=unclassified Paenibacillus TaxID=185978 RepID=UPI001AAF7BC6|nr:type IV pilus twitching motility protein PilT [Paenibacillus sp. F411]MBO2944817.1 type IV pilus twitching motility protein PilT [Paenibacillus sp. F411]